MAVENDYYLQLACYKLAVERILNEKVGGLYIYFTDKGHLHESSWQSDPGQVIKDMLGKIRDYEKNRNQWRLDLNEMKKDNRECRFCEYRDTLCGKKEGSI
ncbi:hypothetical protein ACFLZG_03315 [Thermodesulfobacteriota bacterium]